MSTSPELRDEDRLEEKNEEMILAGQGISSQEIHGIFKKSLPSAEVAAARLEEQKLKTGSVTPGAAIGLYGGPPSLTTPQVSRSSPPQSTKGTNPLGEALDSLRREVLEGRGKSGEAVQLLISLTSKCDNIAKTMTATAEETKREISTLNATITSLQTQQRAVETDIMKVKTYVKDLLKQTSSAKGPIVVPENLATPALPASMPQHPPDLQTLVTAQPSGPAERLAAELERMADEEIPDPFEMFSLSLQQSSLVGSVPSSKTKIGTGYRPRRAI